MASVACVPGEAALAAVVRATAEAAAAAFDLRPCAAFSPARLTAAAGLGTLLCCPGRERRCG